MAGDQGTDRSGPKRAARREPPRLTSASEAIENFIFMRLWSSWSLFSEPFFPSSGTVRKRAVFFLALFFLVAYVSLGKKKT